LAAPAKRAVAIYSDLLGAPTLAFLKAQAESLTRFTPIYVGSRGYGKRGIEFPADRRIVINPSGSLLGKLREIPYKVFGYDPGFFRRVEASRPVLLHAHYGPAGLVALPLARRLNVPLLVTFHGSDVTVRDEYARRASYTHRVYCRHKNLVVKEGSLFLCISQFIRNRLLQQGFPDERTILHYIGVDMQFFHPDGAASRRPVVLFVGSLREVKGCEYLIRAMGQLQELVPDVELVVIGDGPLRRPLQELARKLLRRCRFLGYQPQAVIRDWMRQSKVFSVPSTEAASGATEGLGLVFLEAQATGLPVTSFASGGIPEAVAHGETGLLAPERDWQQLARDILQLLQNEPLRLRMSEAGQKRVRNSFNLETQTRKLEQIYESVLSRYKQETEGC